MAVSGSFMPFKFRNGAFHMSPQKWRPATKLGIVRSRPQPIYKTAAGNSSACAVLLRGAVVKIFSSVTSTGLFTVYRPTCGP